MKCSLCQHELSGSPHCAFINGRYDKVTCSGCCPKNGCVICEDKSLQPASAETKEDGELISLLKSTCLEIERIYGKDSELFNGRIGVWWADYIKKQRVERAAQLKKMFSDLSDEDRLALRELL